MFGKFFNNLADKQTRNFANRVLETYITVIREARRESGEVNTQAVVIAAAMVTKQSPFIKRISVHEEILEKLTTHPWNLTDFDVNDQISLHVLFINTVGGDPESGHHAFQYFLKEVGIQSLPSYPEFKRVRDEAVPSDTW